jgi:anti-sigma-K factor RskA
MRVGARRELAQPRGPGGAYPSSMSAPDHVAEYLLGELPDAERSAFEAALRADPELRAEVERLQPVVACLAALPSSSGRGRYSSSPSSSSST